MTMTDVPGSTELDEDDLGHRFPGKPSELRTIGDDELFRELRRMAYANRWPFDRMAEHEMKLASSSRSSPSRTPRTVRRGP